MQVHWRPRNMHRRLLQLAFSHRVSRQSSFGFEKKVSVTTEQHWLYQLVAGLGWGFVSDLSKGVELVVLLKSTVDGLAGKCALLTGTGSALSALRMERKKLKRGRGHWADGLCSEYAADGTQLCVYCYCVHVARGGRPLLDDFNHRSSGGFLSGQTFILINGF